MSTLARRIVSGKKARFKDDELDVELDLVYLTDRVIIMGYPADGIEAFYRNSRHDIKRFLEHKHGANYWIFNFCPIKENSPYPADFFRGHVSRYPFPDHYAPPLSIIALATREMDLWIRGDPEHVIVLHCKAGKGRSGTLACSYLLSLKEAPSGPRLERNYSKRELANARAEEMLTAIATQAEDEFETIERPILEFPERVDRIRSGGPVADDDLDEVMEIGRPEIGNETTSSSPPLGSDIISSENEYNTMQLDRARVEIDSGALLSTSTAPPINSTAGKSVPDTTSTIPLDSVLAFHTARRMKKPGKKEGTPKRGVSIPSQRRFLFYWSQLVSDVYPSGFWARTPGSVQRVRLREIKVRMKYFGGAKAAAVKVINKVLSRSGKDLRSSEKRYSDIWISLSQYDDELVDTLGQWEKYTRDDSDISRRKATADTLPHGKEGEYGVEKLFDSGKWDEGKMVRSFSRLGAASSGDMVEGKEGSMRVFTHVLHPLPHAEWVNISTETSKPNPTPPDEDSVPGDSASMISEGEDAKISQSEVDDEGIVIDANREVRAKLYMGQISMGWFWFIPTFHMPPFPGSGARSLESQLVHLKLKKAEVDFPLGAGSYILDIDVSLQWVT